MMDSNTPRPSVALRRLDNGYQVTQAIHVAAVLGIADLLVAGPRASDELSAETGAHPDALYRLLRALAAAGMFREEGGQRFALTELGDCLRSDASEPVAGWAAFVGEPYHWQAWGDLLHGVRTGENPFQHIHGADPWTFRARRPELSAGFDRAMTAVSRQVSVAVLDAYDFGRFATVADIGGGNGAFLARLLTAYPAMRGVLFDQPHVVADAYVLKAILHDWEDDDCVRILRVCRGAMAAGAALLVVEREIGPPNENLDAKFGDLNMLVGPGGRDRSVDEYARLFAATGFRFTRYVPSAVGVGV